MTEPKTKSDRGPKEEPKPSSSQAAEPRKIHPPDDNDPEAQYESKDES